MLMFTLAMESFLALVCIIVSLIQCQAITVRDGDNIYDVTPKSYTYSDPDLGKPELEYRQEDFYKALRRSDVPTYQYQSEDSSQEEGYSQLQPKQNSDNYSFIQRGREPQTKRRAAPRKPQVEQYLKEVTPTTKTAYNQRSGNNIRLSGQPRDRIIKQQAEELQRDILKQQSIQYVLQSDLQQKSQSQPQVQYIISEPKSTQFQQNEERPHTAALAAYQNALLAHQKILEAAGQDETSRSSIFVSHTIPKKPVRKILKPTTPEDVDQYTRLHQLQQKQPLVYERQEPAEIVYQAKLEDSTGDTSFQATTEVPSYQNKLLEYQRLRQQLQDLTQYQQVSTEQPLYQEDKLIPQHTQQLAGYQQLLSNSQGKAPGLISHSQQSQHPPAISFQTREGILEYTTPKPKEHIPVQYQPIYTKKGGPKYLPEPKSLRYQPSTTDESEEKYQQVVNIPVQRPEPLISYEAAIAKLQSEKLQKTRQPRLRPQVGYQQEEEDTKPVRYVLPQPSESREATSGTEYVNIDDTDKYQSDTNAATVTYRHPHQNGNVRYYRRPAISYSQYQ